MLELVVRKVGLVVVLAAATATAGCKHLEGLGDQLGLPSPPRVDNRAALETWSKELDSVSAALRRYDLTRTNATLPVSPDYRLTLSGEGSAVRHTITGATYAPYLEGYVRARQDQIDGLCSLFFNDLQGLSSTSRWGRDQFNVLAEFTSLMMGLGGAASKQLAVLSGTQILFNDSYDAASAALLISADPYRVYRAVKTAQTPYDAGTAGSITTFRQAESLVRNYAEPCTLMGVQRLISEALDTQFSGSSASGAALAIKLNGLVSTLNAVPAGVTASLAQADLTPDSLAVVYWVLKLDPIAEERAAALASLSPDMKLRIEALLEESGSSLRPAMVGQIEDIDRMSPSVGRDARKLQADYRVRMAAEAAEAARIAEAARVAAAVRLAEAARIAEEVRLAEIARLAEIDAQRAAEEARVAEEARTASAAQANAEEEDQ